MSEQNVASDDWYAEIIHSANDAAGDISEAQMQQALRIVRQFLPSLEEAVSGGDVGDVEIRLTLHTDGRDLDFNYATD